MGPYLLIDFGTTSTKSALVDLDTGVFSHFERHSAIPPQPAPAGHHEVPLEAIRSRFDEICSHYCDLSPDLGGVVLCSEMHGFAVLDSDTRRPLTPYISWLDARALDSDTFSLVCQRLGDRFRDITGMRPRPGFPLLNLTHLARSAGLPTSALVVSLPAYLAAGESPPDAPVLEHPTILAGMAVYDVRTRQVSAELLDLVRDLTGFAPLLGVPAEPAVVAGHWSGGECPLPVFVGVGDHQCSVLGSCTTPGNAASLNLGTGSQVTVISRPVPGAEVEVRPYFDQRQLCTVTHIPAGRALAEYVGFLERVLAAGGPASEGQATRPDFWQRLSALTLSDLDAATLEIDLSIFEGARGYSDGGGITRVHEGSLTPDNYLASLLKTFVEQYVDVLQAFDPGHDLERLVLSGGIARNLPNLATLLQERTGYETTPATELDESLLGLRSLALVADGRSPTCVEAQKVFGRDCQIAG